MADEDVEKRETQRSNLTTWRRTLRTIERQWHAAAHHPYQHLEVVSGTGDATVLNWMFERERYAYVGPGENGLARFLATKDLEEVGRAITRSGVVSRPILSDS